MTDALLFAPGIAIGRTGPEGGTASVFLNGGNSNYDGFGRNAGANNTLFLFAWMAF